MKNTFKKVIASLMAVASLSMSVAGINVNAADSNALGSTEVAISENPSRSGIPFYLTNQIYQNLTNFAGPRTVYCSASVNQGGVSIVAKNAANEEVESLYFSAGYSPSVAINIPPGSTYYFYACSSTASPSYVISGIAYFN
jgi:hypothetical protein